MESPIELTEYAFQEGIPSGFSRDFESGIFHDPRHLQLQSSKEWHSFALLNPKQRTIVAEVHYHIDADVASSPFRSPYSSFVFSKSISSEQLLEFVNYTEQKLKEKVVHTLLLKNPPDIYTSESQMLHQVLFENGYRVHLEETSAVIAVDDRTYAKILNRSKKDLLRKGHNKLFKFQQFSLSQLSEVYGFLKMCYSERGYQLSMTLEEVQRVTQVFPDKYFLHVVVHHEQIVAASISIRVKPTVLYTFYYNHLKEYDYVSPIVFLCEGLYLFCQENGIDLLDLGTSNKGGQLNEPLINFKLSLGAQPSRKLTFIKNIS